MTKCDQIVVYKISSVKNCASGSDQGIMIDCGASAHIICTKSNFTSFDANFIPSSNFLELADGTRRSDLIKGRGTAVITLHDRQGIERQIKLKDALYVPSFSKNILSYGAGIDSGMSFFSIHLVRNT